MGGVEQTQMSMSEGRSGACAAGVCLALRQDDDITSTHRGHGHCLANGAPMPLIMAELYAEAFVSTQ
jgi:pyruvate dehydrogenase E1 component alpha subunit